MKTTQGKVVTAFMALANMSRKPLNSFTAYKLFRLKKKLAQVVEFQSEEEQKIVEELGGSISETGSIRFGNKDKENEFKARQRELSTMECEIESEKITMMPKEMPELSLADMEALDEFIEWKE